MVGRLGRYELHDVLGTGGFATVYRATDPSLQAVVAVKVLADNWSRDPDARRRFRAEAVLLRRAQSAGSVHGLVEVYDIDEDDGGQPYFVMAYADRGTLAERARGGRWSGADVVAVIDALAETVGALHENDIVHRDLKPTNVLIRSDGRAATTGPGRLVLPDERLLVADLGLARDLRRETTSMSFAGGTRSYMAPEQQAGTGPVDRRADVYAASAIVAGLLDQGEGPAAGGEAPAVGPALRRALERGLAADPSARPPSMAAWRGALLDAMESDGAAALPPASRLSGAPAVTGLGRAARAGPPEGLLPDGDRRPPRRRRWRLPALAGVLVLVLVLAAGWLVTRTGGGGAIVGPSEIVVGEAVRYRAGDTAGPVWWTGPGGERVADADLEIRAVLPGELRVELRVDGDRAVRKVTAVASPVGPTVDSPDRARIGEEIELRPSSPAGATVHYWLGPDGARVDGDVLRLTPTRAGRLSLALVARGPDGIERGVRHRIEVAP